MRLTSMLVLTTLLLLTASCTTITSYPKQLDEIGRLRLDQLNKEYPELMNAWSKVSLQQTAIDTNSTGYNASFSTTVETVQGTYSEKYVPSLESLRNKIILNRVQVVEIVYIDFKRTIFTENAKAGWGRSAVIGGLGFAGILTPAGATQVLSGISGLFSGLGSAYDKEFLFTNTLPALLSQMDASRNKKLEHIYAGLHEKIDAYPLEQGFMDLYELYYLGTLPGAISAVTEVTSQAVADTAKSLKNVRDVNYVKTQKNTITLLKQLNSTPEPKLISVAKAPPEDICQKTFNDVSPYVDSRYKCGDNMDWMTSTHAKAIIGHMIDSLRLDTARLGKLKESLGINDTETKTSQ